MAVVLAGAIAGIALLFDYRYSTLVPADFGLHRLYDYDALPLVLVAAAAVEIAGRLLGSRLRRSDVLVAGAACVLAGVAIWGTYPSRATTSAAAAAQLFSSVEAAVPCHARILPDARTAGSFATITGRRSVVEGMAPYLNPVLMHRVLPVLFGAREFFTHPQENSGFLREEHIDYVLLLTDPTVRIGQSGGRLGRHVDYPHVRTLPELHRIVVRPSFELYSVGDPPRPQANDDPKPCSTAIA
jgi:hypothetical protein